MTGENVIDIRGLVKVGSFRALVPAQDVDWAAVVGVGVVAVLLSVAGQLAFRRRDVH